jgi:hypothetical protein
MGRPGGGTLVVDACRLGDGRRRQRASQQRSRRRHRRRHDAAPPSYIVISGARLSAGRGPADSRFIGHCDTRRVRRNAMNAGDSSCSKFALCYDSLHQQGRGLCFPCDARGTIDIDTLPDRARNNYYLARTTVGRDFAHPVVQRMA